MLDKYETYGYANMTIGKIKMAKKKTVSVKKAANKNQKRIQVLGNFTRHHAIAALTFITAVAAGVSLLPESSPISLASLTGKNTDRIAPKLDTLTGNYSVAGEAASSSLLIKYKPSVNRSQKEIINREMGAKTKREIGRLGVDIVQVDSRESMGDIMRRFRSKAEIDYVEPNYLAKRFLLPNDSLFPKQWHLTKVDAPKAWDISQGGFGPVAIIDTGITSSQTDLNGSVVPGYNFVNDTTDTNDDNGHGTHVAGIVNASSNNGTGVASIGFKGALMPIKVLDASGAGTYGDVSSGIIYATDNGARIINLSLGGPSTSRTLEDAVNYARSKGVIIVAAAGNNSNNTPVYPAAYPGVVAVSASDQNDNLASFSSYGSHIYISAPGTNIISTYNSGGYATLSGTSMATPMVSGLIGLALSKGATTNIIEDLKIAADKVGPYAYDANGWNQYFGYGRINAGKLLGSSPSAAPIVTEPAPTHKKTNKGNGRSTNPRKSETFNEEVQFETVVEGVIDSTDSGKGIVVLKVKSSSRNLQLRENNLIDLYIVPNTSIKSAGKNITLQNLVTGNSLHIKAEWKDNRLHAAEINVVGAGRNKQASLIERVMRQLASL